MIAAAEDIPAHPLVGLRLYRDEEAGHLFSLVRGALPELSRWLSWSTDAYTLDDARRFIDKARRHACQTLGPFELAVTVDDCPVGTMTVSPVSLHPRVANLGYWLATSHTGQGLALAAARQMTAWALATLDLVRLEIVVAARNHRSRTLAERLGARLQAGQVRRASEYGRVVDAVLYVMRASDVASWPDQRRPELGSRA